MSKKAFSCFNYRGKCFPEAIRFPIGHFWITCLSALTAREARNGYQAFSVFTVGSGLSGQGKEMEARGIGNQQYLLPRTVTRDLSTSFTSAASVLLQSKLRSEAESSYKNVNLKNLSLVSHYS